MIDRKCLTSVEVGRSSSVITRSPALGVALSLAPARGLGWWLVSCESDFPVSQEGTKPQSSTSGTGLVDI